MIVQAFILSSGDFQAATDPFVPTPDGCIAIAVPPSSDGSLPRLPDGVSAPAEVKIVALPGDFDARQMDYVWNGKELVPAESVTTWYVDSYGTRRAFRGDAAWTVFNGGRADPTLSLLKAQLKTDIDARAETLRLTLITPGSGQAMEYQEAFEEASRVDAALKADPKATLDPGGFPMLSASVGYDLDPETGKPTADIAGEARSVLAAYAAYQQAGAAIRRARLKAKAAIDGAASVNAARAAFDAIEWPELA